MFNLLSTSQSHPGQERWTRLLWKRNSKEKQKWWLKSLYKHQRSSSEIGNKPHHHDQQFQHHQNSHYSLQHSFWLPTSLTILNMQFSVLPIAFLASLVGDAMALHLYFSGSGFIVPSSTTDLHTDDGQSHRIWTNKFGGCTTNGYWWLKDFCLDDKQNRGHLYFTSHPNNKRCLKKTSSRQWRCGGSEGCVPNSGGGNCVTCHEAYYTEVECTW